MKSKKIPTCARPRERGAILAALGVAIMALLALAMVGVDVGRIAFTAAEVQTVADTAAHSGALAILEGGNIDAAAHNVARQNTVDGSALANANVTVEPGHYTFSPDCSPDRQTGEGCFTAGAVPTNAVRATAVGTVNNVLAGIFGSPTSTITKLAIAAVGQPRSAIPLLPIVLGDCCFPDDCTSNSCLPSETHPSTLDNSAWTGFSNGASTNSILSYFDPPCGSGAGSGADIPSVDTGDFVSVTNGEGPSQFRAVRCMVCDPNIGRRDFLVPTVECSGGGCGTTTFNGTMKVTGFATIHIDSFHFTSGNKLCQGYSGPQSGQAPDGINYHAVIHTDPVGVGAGGGGDCPGCPVKNVAMVQ